MFRVPLDLPLAMPDYGHAAFSYLMVIAFNDAHVGTRVPTAEAPSPPQKGVYFQ